MALVSPGVEVTIVDESFFVPAQAPTVPLLFIATADEKTQPDGTTPAAGTYEHDVVRTVTSLNQSTQLYGIPSFREDSSGNQQHGDARNEYGLLALNQFLGVGNLAYVVRANVNLNDDIDDIRDLWDRQMGEAALLLESLATAYITEQNEINNYTPANPNYKRTITRTEFISLSQEATAEVFESFSFQNSEDNFFDNNTVPSVATAGYQIADFGGLINNAVEVWGFGGTINSASQVIDLGGAIIGATLTGLVDDQADAQTEADFNGAGSNGTFTAGDANYSDGDTITLSNGAVVTVVTTTATPADGSVATFTVDTTSATQVASGDVLTQASTSGTGAGFTLTIGNANLAGTQTYDLRVTVDGALTTVTLAATAAETYTDLLAEVNTDLAAGTNPATAELLQGNLRILSDSTTSSTISIQDGAGVGAANPLLGNLPDFVAINTATIGATNPTGLTDDATNYTIAVTVDGGVAQNLIVQGQNAQTFGDLLIRLNDLLSGAVVEIVDGDLHVTSDLTDVATSDVSSVDGNLLSTTSGFSAIVPAVVGGAKPTGLANDATNYTASITVDGIPRAIQITGSAAQTFTTLLSEINGDLGGTATAVIGDGTTATNGITVPNGQIGVVSVTTGVNSLITISNVSLFNNLNDFVSLLTPVVGLPANMNLQVYGNGYDQPATGVYLGLEGIAEDWENNSLGSLVPGQWTPTEAGSTLLSAADDYKFTVEFLNETSLGANDAARRVAITTALQSSINSNTEVRSENYEYNLILAPGYSEVVDELIALATDIDNEAFVIADTPVDEDPDGVVTWAATTARFSSPSVAYYYPWALQSNLDGVNVVGAPSGVALRTYAFSDNTSEVWFAPAGTRRGLVSGVSQLGYVTGTLGTATTFVETNLNVGQRDNMYKDFTNLNPITFFPGRGFVIWGQKTSSPDLSARNRVNVERLVAFIKRQLRKSLLSFVFEPNDTLTRDNVKAVVDNFLGDIVIRRGLYDFATVCDESNNTAARIDRNELWVDVAIKPVKAAEFIFVPIRIVATDAEI